MSKRAVYIPPAKRKQPLGQHPPRFHGAFTGGFSAGHFNTVGTREGWTPSTEPRRQQTMEDFMDEQDVHEWGGPTAVRQDFTNGQSTTEGRSRSETAPLDALLLVAPRPLRAGPRLLRHLGWREGAGAAFVPTTTAPAEAAGTNDDHSQIHLSKRKLRQIELQSSRVKILPPKLDRCGLGFEPLEKAPEFQRYRQQRQELASARARGQSNIYRVSNLTGGGDGNEPSSSHAGHDNSKGGEYLSYETVEDFIGTRSSSGFALRDDDDDAYDPTALGGDRNDGKPLAKGSRLSQDYHNEIVDPDEDSDVDDDAMGIPSKKANNSFVRPSKHVNTVLAGALASWAGKNEPIKSNVNDGAQAIMSASLTSSGRPPLPGFRLGGSMESHKKRYPGPDLPRDYQLKPHQFGPNERPAILHTIGRAMQLEGKQRAREVQQSEQQQLKERKRSEQPPLGGNQFATLATAMRSRFTSATERSMTDTDQTPIAGLYQPPKIHNKNHSDLQDTAQSGSSVPNPVAVKRSTQSFLPLPLVCKRFGVSLIRHTPRLAGIETDHKVTEASFFETEILGAVRDAAVTSGTTELASSDQKRRPASATIESIVEEPMVQIPRPSKEELKAIFEPESDGASSSSDDTDLDSLHGETSLVQKGSNRNTSLGEGDDISVDKGVMIQYEAQDLAVNVKTNENSQSEDEADSSDGSSSHRRESKRKRSHKRRKKDRKRSHSKRSSRDEGESSVDDLDGGKKERRRHRDHRKHSKKRRKKA